MSSTQRTNFGYFFRMRLVHWILLAVAVTGTITVVSRVPLDWSASRIAGVGILMLSFAWIAIARLQLGQAFSVTAQARQLVTTGLYKRIRNPIYVASPLVLVGLALTLAQWWPLVLLVVVIPLQLIRARREAAVLRAAFGSAYDDYRSQTWF